MDGTPFFLPPSPLKIHSNDQTTQFYVPFYSQR